jgi:PKD repeat protein
MHLRRAPVALLAITALALLLPSGCSKKDSVTNPRVGPAAGFSAAPVSGIRPLDVDFTNLSAAGSSPITTVLWNFGDGTTSSATAPAHTYAMAGTYTVSLTVGTADGSSSLTKDAYVSVSDGPGTSPPNAAFSGSPSAGNAPLAVTFTDTSTPGSSPITGWSWTFGDGATSTAQSPIHTYASNGSYTVALTVTTSDGSDTETKPGYIVVTSAPVPPTAQFSATPLVGVMPLTVQFTDQSSPGTQAITAWSWTFGDGGTSTAANPTHTYTLAGTYTVTLKVTTTVGSDSDTQTNYITVHPTPVPPTADFSGTPTAGLSPLLVQFTDHSTAGTSPITAWLWTFGDGGTSTSANPSHTYASPGSYAVSLQVTTADGQNTKTRAAYIQACRIPVADFFGTPLTGLAPLTVQFTDLTTGAPAGWTWNFGDGSSNGTQNPSHVYSAPGIYSVSLRVENACGTDSIAKSGYISVGDPCPNPVYSIVNAMWDTVKPAGSTYHTSARLRWNADVSPSTCVRSVFAKIYDRAVGTTVWTLLGQSNCYTITDSRTLDLGSFTVSGLPQACYDFRIVLFECGGTTEKAALEPTDDTDLTNQCFQP